jgi:hypothetical protein
MPLSCTTVSRAAPFALFAALAFAPAHRTAASPTPPQPSLADGAAPGADVEVRYIDESTMKLKLLEERLELVTKYGVLQIPIADVRRVELASRVPPEVAEKVSAAIGRLGHPDFVIRERASAELKGYRERAYPALVRATKHADPEVGRRAEEAVRHLQLKVPANHLEPREFDIVHTEDSKFTGKLTTTSLRVLTFQFGEQHLRLADVRVIRSGAGVAAEELAAAGPAPANLMAYQNQFGKEMAFAITGHPGGGQGGGVWGTDIYTLDSNVAAAAVHAGIVQPGQLAAVRVRIVQSPPQFVGSFRNGIGSNSYGHYPSGGFEFVRK